MKKLLVLLLCLIVTLSACLTSCGGSEATSEEENKQTSAEASSEVPAEVSEEASAASEYVADVPIKDFGGDEVVILIRGEDAGDFTTWDLIETEHNTDAVNSAIKERNDYIESTFNVKIKAVLTGGGVNNAEMRKILEQDAASGESSCHFAYLSVYDAIDLAGNGQLYDLSELPNIDLSKPWWDKAAMDSITIADRYYFGIGDLSIQIYETMPCVVFNKELAKTYVTEDLYKLVDEGKWTLDKFYQFAKGVYNDTDEIDGPSTGDTFGIGGQSDNMWTLLYGAGCQTTVLNKYGEPEVDVVNDRSQQVVQSIMELMNDRETFFSANHYFDAPGYTSTPVEFVVKGFKEGRILFYSEGLLHLNEFRDVDFEFGILPEPKYDEEQDGYHSIIGTWGATAIVVPTSTKNVDIATTIIEAMAAKSKNTVSVEYFERVLNIQTARDSDSENSLKIILANKGFDMGTSYNWGKIQDVIYNSVWTNKFTMVSDYDSRSSGIESAMARTIETFSNLPHYTGDN